jgi:hypothetical protein
VKASGAGLIANPLLGSIAPISLQYSAYGAIVAPAGTLFDVDAPAAGYTRYSYDANSGSKITAAFLPTVSPESISAGRDVLKMFPIYAYAEGSYVRRVGDLDIGIGAVASLSTAELMPQTPSADPAERLSQNIQRYQEGRDRPANAGFSKPNLGLRLFGRF